MKTLFLKKESLDKLTGLRVKPVWRLVPFNQGLIICKHRRFRSRKRLSRPENLLRKLKAVRKRRTDRWSKRKRCSKTSTIKLSRNKSKFFKKERENKSNLKCDKRVFSTRFNKSESK
jgi:hypothetical protein